eukprot:2596555-Rhodomonas_salina.2
MSVPEGGTIRDVSTKVCMVLSKQHSTAPRQPCGYQGDYHATPGPLYQETMALRKKGVRAYLIARTEVCVVLLDLVVRDPVRDLVAT